MGVRLQTAQTRTAVDKQLLFYLLALPSYDNTVFMPLRHIERDRLATQ